MTSDQRRYWLWVTRPKYYEWLEGISECEGDGWWTCHKDTKKGDLILLWRTTPKSDIGFLIQAKSDAYSISKKSKEPNWKYGCDYKVILQFDRPIGIEDIRDDAYLADWNALRGNFQRQAYSIDQATWRKLSKKINTKNEGYSKRLKNIEKTKVVEKIMLEEQIETILENNLRLLKGYSLKLFVDPDSGTNGRQFVCVGNGGRIDLLCVGKKPAGYVVIEIKNQRVGRDTFGQISQYMGWVMANMREKRPVHGLVVCRSVNNDFENAL